MYKEEFPSLRPVGLYAAHISGDGNCLFNALSDQLHGTEAQHAVIRARVIEYMRSNADYYKMFLEVYPGGGTRRNPKRKNAGAVQAVDGPSAADIDRVWEEHVTRMARGGTWGDNLEIQAFADAFNTNVKIYQFEQAYMLMANGGNGTTTAHIAYHRWEHYSSIRNLDGPHTGLPNVSPKMHDPSMQAKLEQDTQTSSYPVQEWQMKALATAYPAANDHNLQQALEASKGDIDGAFERLLSADNLKPPSSQQSSSVEREDDDDSDEDAFRGPKKRQDRRMSRTSKAQQNACARNIAAGWHKHKDSLDSLVQSHPSTFMLRQIKPTSSSSSSVVDDTWTPPPLADGETSSGSEYTPEPDAKPDPPKIRIKLSMPKKDESKDASFNASKPSGVQKAKPVSARQKKDTQKRDQKTAAKQRKQAASSGKQNASAASSFDQSNHPSAPANAMRVLYI